MPPAVDTEDALALRKEVDAKKAAFLKMAVHREIQNLHATYPFSTNVVPSANIIASKETGYIWHVMATIGRGCEKTNW